MTADLRAELRTVCETTVEAILRDAAQLGWKYAEAGVPLSQARADAVAAAHEQIVGIVDQILIAGAAIA